MRVLLLEFQVPCGDCERALRDVAGRVLVARLEPGLGGIWSDFDEAGREVIRMGFPRHSPHAWFRPLTPGEGADTCVSIALGRTVFGRGIDHVAWVEDALTPVAVHALSTHDIHLWPGARRVHARSIPFGRTPLPPITPHPGAWTETAAALAAEAKAP